MSECITVYSHPHHVHYITTTGTVHYTHNADVAMLRKELHKHVRNIILSHAQGKTMLEQGVKIPKTVTAE